MKLRKRDQEDYFEDTQETELKGLFGALASGEMDSFDPDIINKYKDKTIEELLTLQCDLHVESIKEYARAKAEQFATRLEEVKAELLSKS